MIRHYSVAMAGGDVPATSAVTVEALGDDRWRVVVAGQERIWNARRVLAGAKHASYSLHVDGGGTHQQIDVDGSAPDLTVGVTASTGVRLSLLAKLGDSRSQVAALGTPKAQTGPQSLRSPMPGKVVKVLVKVGDEVKAGTPVVVVEAMKMENELRCTRDGVVKEIPVVEGQTVESGHVVAVLV